jgi:hypothetical protein
MLANGWGPGDCARQAPPSIAGTWTRGTGPRSAAGKKRSSRNAYRGAEAEWSLLRQFSRVLRELRKRTEV